MFQELEVSGCSKVKFLKGLKREELMKMQKEKFLSQATEPGNYPSYSKEENWSFKINEAN